MGRLAPTSDNVESLDFVGPNPPPCVGEGIISGIPAKAGIQIACDSQESSAETALDSPYAERLE